MSFLRRLFAADIRSYLAMAEKYERLGKLGMARLELDRALESVGIGDAAQRAEINAFLDRLAQREQEDAETRARESLKEGDFKRARYYLNVALSKVEEGSQAYDNLQNQLQAIPEDPDGSESYDELETLLTEEAGVDFVERQRALEFWKSGFPPYKEDYYFRKALSSEAVRDLAEQVQRAPDDADTRFNFGITLAQLGLIDKAAEQIRHVVSLKPEDRDAHYFLANLLADQGRDDEAIREFEKTISIDPEFAEGYFYLGEHYEKLEDYERAKMCFEHVLRNKSSQELAEEARGNVEALRNKRAPYPAHQDSGRSSST